MFTRLERYAYSVVAALALYAAVLAAWPTAAHAQAAPAKDAQVAERVVVESGDSLWTISQERLGPDATAQQLDREVERIYALNHDRIGPNPNLIFPGQELLVPPQSSEQPASKKNEKQAVVAAPKKPAPEKVGTKTPAVKTSTTSDRGAEPLALPALPAAREALPRVDSLRVEEEEEGDVLPWPPTVGSLVSSKIFGLVIIVLGVCPVALLVWALRRHERREAAREQRWSSSSWEELYGKNYTRFDPLLSFEETLRLAAAPPRAPEESGIGSNGAAPPPGAPGGAAALARARRERIRRGGGRRRGRALGLRRLPRRGLATGVYAPEVRRSLRERAPRTRPRVPRNGRVKGARQIIRGRWLWRRP